MLQRPTNSLGQSLYIEFRAFLRFFLCHYLSLHFSAAAMAPNSVLRFKLVKLYAPVMQNEDCPQAESYKNEKLTHCYFLFLSILSLHQPILGRCPLLSGSWFLHFAQNLWFYLLEGLSERAIWPSLEVEPSQIRQISFYHFLCLLNKNLFLCIFKTRCVNILNVQSLKNLNNKCLLY